MSKSSSQVITCRAAVCWGMGEVVKVEEIQVEPPKEGEVRIKMLRASLCHTDILFSQGFPVPLYPRVLGHEGVGMVENAGKNVQNLKEGDIVIPTYLGECKACENCKSGKTNLCETYPMSLSGIMPDGTSRMSVRGEKLYHSFTCSTWSEYTVVNANYIVKIDPRIALSHASCISCGYTTGFGATWKDTKVENGSSVAVLGLGAVGLGVVEGARAQGAAKIIGIDKNEKRSAKATVFGVTDFINPTKYDKPISELIKDLTEGKGVDYAFECAGATGLLNEALESTKLGKGVAVAIGAENQHIVEINFLSLVTGRTLKGSIFGGIKPQSDLPLIVEKCIKKELQVEELLTHEITLEDLSKVFELVKQQDCLKVLIKI